MTIRTFSGAIASAAALAAAPAVAQDAAQPAPAPQDWALHAQTTFVTQGVFGFPSPYEGPNSLVPHQLKETFDATLYVGVRPWAGAELWANPEIDQGFGLSNTLGAAGSPVDAVHFDGSPVVSTWMNATGAFPALLSTSPRFRR